MQYNMVCRGCLAVDGKFSYIHHSTTAQAYTSLVGIPVMPMDGFPLYLCSFCLRTVHKFVEFKTRCIKAHQLLHFAQGEGHVVTKEYYQCLTLNCPEFKQHYLKTDIVIVDIEPKTVFVEQQNDMNQTDIENYFEIDKKEMIFDEFDNSCVTDGVDKAIDEKETLFLEFDNTCVTNDVNQPIHKLAINENLKSEINETEVQPCNIFVSNLNETIKSDNIIIKGAPKLTKVKNELSSKAKKRVTKLAEPDNVKDVANTFGFDFVELSYNEQIKEIEERKKIITKTGCVCRDCGKRFTDSNVLERHVKKNHNYKQNRFVCDICTWVFKRKNKLRDHIYSHSWLFTCRSCDYKTNYQSNLVFHSDFHKGKQFNCEYCDQVFKKSTSKLSHVRLKHGSEMCWCDLCGEFFIGKKGVLFHKSQRHDMAEEFPEVCEKCDKRFKSETALMRHVTVNGCENPSCVQCGDSFHNDQLLKYHLVQRHFSKAIPNMYKCEQCTLRFYTMDALVRHICKSMACLQCGDHFETTELLTEHVMGHGIFKCQECGKQFTNSTYFKHHYDLNHSGEEKKPRRVYQRKKVLEKREKVESKVRKWSVVVGSGQLVMESGSSERSGVVSCVCEHCGKGYPNSTKLAHHQITHAGENSYICPQCHKGFKHKSYLIAHQRVHTGERPYKCKQCPKSFTAPAGLYRHMLIHSGERKHICNVCDKAFQTSTSVKLHIKSVHLNIPCPARNRKRKTQQQ